MRAWGVVLLSLGAVLGGLSSFGLVHGGAWLAFLSLGGLLLFIDAEFTRGTKDMAVVVDSFDERIGDLEEWDRGELEAADKDNAADVKKLWLAVATLQNQAKNPRDDSVLLKALADLNDKVIRVENRTLPKR